MILIVARLTKYSRAPDYDGLNIKEIKPDTESDSEDRINRKLFSFIFKHVYMFLHNLLTRKLIQNTMLTFCVKVLLHNSKLIIINLYQKEIVLLLQKCLHISLQHFNTCSFRFSVDIILLFKEYFWGKFVNFKKKTLIFRKFFFHITCGIFQPTTCLFDDDDDDDDDDDNEQIFSLIISCFSK
ncbi:hypothetical protein KUTeg_023988 [Tegillarca granosa]|uniref:Uncharacterized protein n=1 Tax=Tegillarca granosa TaxID=220873 RepID=A0ABQ9DWQ7_TEGGR|nr:hypothetical protein KUTeg_023988 [Tegillarca granosa]